MKEDMRDAFFGELVEQALQDDRVVFLSADHGAFALKKFEEMMPRRYFNVGIAEQNMIGVAAGLASMGKIVFAYGISPFVSLRVLEHLTVDVAANNLPVNVVSVGAGFTYSTDGPTHQGLQDMSAVLTVPGMGVLNSSDPRNTKEFVKTVISRKAPHYIRIEKEKVERLVPELSADGYEIICDRGKKNVIVTTGIIVHKLESLREKISFDVKKDISLLNITQIKPFTPELLSEMKDWENVLIIEEGYKSGFVSHLVLALSENEPGAVVMSVTPEEKYWFEADTRESMYEKAGLSEDFLERSIFNWLGRS